mgnify:CR=1 FL=1
MAHCLLAATKVAGSNDLRDAALHILYHHLLSQPPHLVNDTINNAWLAMNNNCNNNNNNPNNHNNNCNNNHTNNWGVEEHGTTIPIFTPIL